MKILVCIKQVADQEAKFTIKENKAWLSYEAKTSYWINRYDEHAIEAALQIREAIPDTTVDIISIGPERVRTAVRRGMEMGADAGFHLLYDKEAYLSPAVKSRLLAIFASEQAYDLILTGVMSEDMMSGQTGPMLAARLGIPSATSVMGMEVNIETESIHLERELDSGGRAKMDLSLPALIAVQSGINRPRYPSFSNVMRAKNTDIIELVDVDTSLAHNYERVKEIIDIKSDRDGLRPEGTREEKAQVLRQILYEKSLI